MLYYNITGRSRLSAIQMTHHDAHHHHHPGEAHPSAQAAPSLLRMSVAERLAGAAVVIALLWSAVLWAMR